MSPRISTRDFEYLYRHDPDQLLAVDIRAAKDYAHIKVPHSINIPFDAQVMEFSHLDALNIPQLEQQFVGRIVVCISNIHENAVQVSWNYFRILY